MSNPADFLDHGTLPFVGRSRQMERLLKFWRATARASELRAVLLLGETGVGKSRLIEELIPRILKEEGAIIHTKLYPESTTATAPLIARALWNSDAGRHLLRQAPEGTLPSVAAALRRLARLRPTLLIMEDIHLLVGEALREFALLLSAVAEEPLSLLCSTRPVELSARGTLERYLVEEVDLPGLKEKELISLWKEIFGSGADFAILPQLLETTLGNPLAIRSALRGALKSKVLTYQGSNDKTKIKVEPSAFTMMLRRNVGLLSEGMAAHLSDREKRIAGELALLGEIFSREAAEAMIDNADEEIAQLISSGIIATSSIPMEPLSGMTTAVTPNRSPSSRFPLIAFTHTLLHRYLVEQSNKDFDRLVGVIAADLPLYSIFPFELLAGNAARISTAHQTIRKAIDRGREVALALDRTPDWQLGSEVWKAASALFEYHADGWTSEQRREIEAALLNARISLLGREMHAKETHALVASSLELTAHDLNEQLAEHRLDALHFSHIVSFFYDHSASHELWKEAENLVERFPSLIASRKYINYLRIAGMVATAVSDEKMVRLVEGRFADALTAEGVSEEHRRGLRSSVAPTFLLVFNSEKEMRERLQLLAELEEVVSSNDNPFRVLKIAFLYKIGHVIEAIRACDEAMPQFIERGARSDVFQCSLTRLCALACMGLDLPELAAQTRLLCSDIPESLLHKMHEEIGGNLSGIGILRGDLDWTRNIVGEFLAQQTRLEAEERIILASSDEDLRSISQEIRAGEKTASAIRLLAGLILDAEVSDQEALRQEIERELRSPIFTRRCPLTKLAIIHLLERDAASSEHRSLLAALRPAIHDALSLCLGWFVDCSMFPFMIPLLDRYGEYLTKKERATWRTRAGEMARRHEAQIAATRSDDRLKISMLGTITTQRPGEEPQRLRGARQRTLLGLMVADRMLENPLEHREFRRLAAGGEEEPERARKTMNMAVYRLREAIGEEGVLTDEETPRLNLAHVQIDLLEAHALIRRSRGALRERALIRAYPALRQALDITRGEVSFPTLYDNFFEAAREDFEFELRSAIIDIAKGLLIEEDAISAEELLRRGFAAMPGDEEMSDLLCEALEMAGKRTTAERVRMQVAGTLND